MIKLNELRHGNLVVHKGEVIEWDWGKLTEGANVWLKVGGAEITVDPVQLSESILAKLQFARKITRGTQPDCTVVESISFHINLNGYEIMVRELYEKWLINFRGGGYNPQGQIQMSGNRRIIFAHELQNLVFALTGEELIFKEP